ncbi:Cys/Met metabolism PLP-dependent enzyme [Planifilum fimeticola]|uniref:homocysteine desulfhydrase n=1 Tax=Planifilum fimeticola TaxID=201975 RepID=A0A2T0LGA9_9BACL|nr:Cys/Met metabolism PLP-dependent enzyme [Planifilum fimeticola]
MDEREKFDGFRNETLVIHADEEVVEDGTVAPAIYYSATFRARDAAEFREMASTSRHPRYYTRYGNPVHERVAKVIAGLEGTETAIMTGSGMGAIATTLLALVQAGDHVIAQTRHYMGTAKIMDEMLPKFGVEVTLVEQTDVGAFEKAVRPNTKLIMLESPANPTMVVTDIAAVTELARPHGIIVVADNTFATPINQRPHDLGVDVVVHSATKYLGGHHDLTAGVICTREDLAERIWQTHISLGSSFRRWMPGCCFGGCARCRSGWNGSMRTPSPWPAFWRSSRRSSGCTIPGCPAIRSMNWRNARCAVSGA